MSSTTKPLLQAHILIFFIFSIISICSTRASAVLPHAYSPSTSPSPAPSPATAPSPSPTHHHHHHNHTHHHHHNHTHHATSPSPAHSPASPPHSSVMPPSHPPTAHSPVKPPTVAPAPAPYAKPPSKGPSPPHGLPPRKLVAVEGVVYCKNCSYSGVDTLMGASPLPGATVELRCKNTKYMIKKTSTTDKNGFFFLQAPKHITTYGAHKCLVFLLNNTSTTTTSGAHKCSHATNLNNGVSGAFLFLNKKMGPPPKPLPYTVYSVGPFAFESSKCYKH